MSGQDKHESETKSAEVLARHINGVGKVVFCQPGAGTDLRQCACCGSGFEVGRVDPLQYPHLRVCSCWQCFKDRSIDAIIEKQVLSAP